MVGSFPNLEKGINIQVQKSQSSPIRVCPNKATLVYINKLSKRILENTKQKSASNIWESLSKANGGFLSRNLRRKQAANQEYCI
jgi:hypothetical protein